MASTKPLDIFISYAHEDQTFLTELANHLSTMRKQGIIHDWHDGHISPGAEWEKLIMHNLNSATVILLLISADFMASDFCYGIEVRRAIERHTKNEACVIPIILRPTDTEGAPFAHLQFLPTGGKPVTRWPTRDDGYEDIVQGIKKAIKELP